MRPFSAGFSDELEKLALRLPSMGEMTSSLGSSEPSPVAETAAPAAPAKTTARRNVTPRHSQPARATAAVPPAAAAKAPADIPTDASMPKSPTGFGLKTPEKTFTGRHGEQLPSEMRREPQYSDLGTGPKKDTYVSGRGLASFLGSGGHALATPTSTPPPLGGGKVTNLGDTITGSDVESDYAGLERAKGPKVPKMHGTAVASNAAKL